MDGKAEQQENDLGSNASSENTKNDEQLQQAQAKESLDFGERKNKTETLAVEAAKGRGVKPGEQESEKASADPTRYWAKLTAGRDIDSFEPGEGAADETPAVGETPAEANLPMSETFKRGESAENKALIGELLSREGSITLEDGSDHDNDENRLSNLDTGTAKLDSPKQVEGKGPTTTEEAGPSLDYKEQMNFLHELRAENKKLGQLNAQLQTRLAEYLRGKSGDDAGPEKKAVSDVEQRYRKYLAVMEELKWKYRCGLEAARQQAEDLRQQSRQKLDLVDREWSAFAALKRDVAVTALSRCPGKQAAVAEVERIQAAEQRRETELVAVRLGNIKLKNKTRRLEAALRAKEELAVGLHLIDFEQLKIENQTFSEKIEERNEELLRLRKKITNTVHVLTHAKEKLQFVQTENQSKRARLAEVEAAVARKRDVLTRTKQARDGLRADNLKQRRRCGLLGNETLLRDFEDKVDASDALEERLEGLKRRQAQVTLECARIKKKLEHSQPLDQ